MCLIPKYDKLCVTMEAHNPDMICIVETWLCADVLDSEIALPGYQVYRIGMVEVFSFMLGIILYATFFLQLIILRSILFQFVMVLARLLYHFSTDPLILYHKFLKIYFCTYMYNHSMLVVLVTIFC